MIYVTQGHESGIGLEVFLKSFLTLPENKTQFFTLITNIEILKLNLINIKLKYLIQDDLLIFHNRKLKIISIEKSSIPLSTLALEVAINKLKETKGILVTLPTSKDQLIINKKSCLGYTEYFRLAFNNPDLPMFFYSENLKLLLLTDHIEISQISNQLTKKLIINKIKSTFDFHSFDNIYISGINPHAGENGLLGGDENVLSQAILELQKMFPAIKFYGPIAGDTLHYKINTSDNQLLVYSFHDQGLILFKSRQSLLGINITLGLPFLRFSVDHGTAFELFGKNQANHLGCFYTLIKALEFYEQ